VSRPAVIAKLLLKPLRALGARSAAAVGDSYARAAQTLLTQYERLEDDAAERRYQRRASHTRVSHTRVSQTTELPTRGGTTVAKS
jgi:hypothetical protein